MLLTFLKLGNLKPLVFDPFLDCCHLLCLYPLNYLFGGHQLKVMISHWSMCVHACVHMLYLSFFLSFWWKKKKLHWFGEPWTWRGKGRNSTLRRNSTLWHMNISFIWSTHVYMEQNFLNHDFWFWHTIFINWGIIVIACGNKWTTSCSAKIRSSMVLKCTW